MIQTKILSIEKEKVFILIQFIALITIVLIAPIFKNQLITGSIVNTALFVSTVVLGLKAGILIGLLPSLFALMTGLLPIILVPMIPLIVSSNIILVVVFNFLRSKNYWLAVFSASFLKFSFLFLTSLILINVFLTKESSIKAAVLMMGWPQILTALIGGLTSYLFLKNNRNEYNV